MNRTGKSILVYGLIFAVLLSLSLAACGPANGEEPKVDFPPESNNIEDPGASAETGEQAEAEAVKEQQPRQNPRLSHSQRNPRKYLSPLPMGAQ